MILLETENIVKQYSSHLALDGVSMRVSSGSVHGLLGPNGAGKTTLIRIVNRIILQDSGAVFFMGYPISSKDVFRIGYLPEQRGLYPKMKVWDHALFLARLKGLSKKNAVERLSFWFDKLQMNGWKNSNVEQLSKGMQQKVQFLAAVIHAPDLLILDEPFDGFDPLNSEILKNELLELKSKGTTIILSTHRMHFVEELCDELTLIDQSKVLLQGSVSDVINKFKNGVLRLLLKSDSFDLPSHFYEVLSVTSEAGGHILLRLKKTYEITNSDVLRCIAQKYEIILFEEEMPTMNEIFIQSVCGK